MTRDEIIEYYTHLLERREKNSQIVDDSFVKDSLTDLFESVIRELKQPQLDAETGLMPCGCGGKAKIWPSDPAQFTHVITDYDLYSFECIKCETGTLFFNTKEDAKNAWNRAMGYADAVQGQ